MVFQSGTLMPAWVYLSVFVVADRVKAIIGDIILRIVTALARLYPQSVTDRDGACAGHAENVEVAVADGFSPAIAARDSFDRGAAADQKGIAVAVLTAADARAVFGADSRYGGVRNGDRAAAAA